jgi:phosphatidylethanolamine/phosphatidyl-N-methylethanolamine N-methyltransferase
MALDGITFLARWLRRPLGIGAALPSGRMVGRAVARRVQLERPGMVLELGGGTGSLTRAMLAGGCPAGRLVVVEREPQLVSILARRFPGVRIIEGDACALRTLLERQGIGQLATVVSSVPIKWFSRSDQRAVLEQSFDLLGPGGHVLQLTNAMTSPVALDLGFDGAEVERIWLNFPPIQIWCYRRRDGGR